MGTYKVIQDIEAEDKLFGPFTLRQFIYGAVVIGLGFIGFKLVFVSPFLVIPLVPPMLFFGLLAAPFGHDQSSEVWLLAKIRFMIKPRRRIWDQSGMQELVTITVPKKIEHMLTDGLDQTEVRSRLQALANTLDSRGWAVKNVNLNMSNQPYAMAGGGAMTDRLVDASTLPQDVPTYDVLATDDMLDTHNNMTAQHLDTMINQSTQARRESLVATAQGKAPAATQPADYWFMNQPDQSQVPAGMATFSSTTVTPGSTTTTNTATDITPEDQAVLKKIHDEKAKPNTSQGHMKVVDPKGSGENSKFKVQRSDKDHMPKVAEKRATKTVASPEIVRLANNDDLNIATIAREAKKATTTNDGEVVISLR